jgi:hypothetical protein
MCLWVNVSLFVCGEVCVRVVCVGAVDSTDHTFVYVLSSILLVCCVLAFVGSP